MATKGRLVEFFHDLDYHGPGRSLTRGSTCRAVVWFLLLTLLFLMFLFSMSNNITAYLEYPVATVTSTDEFTSASLPAMTVCNKNYVVQERADPAALAYTDLLAAGTDPGTGSSREGLRPSVPRADAMDFVRNNGYQQDWLMLSDRCVLYPDTALTECSKFNVTSMVMFPYGRCFTVNGGGEARTSRPGMLGAFRIELIVSPNQAQVKNRSTVITPQNSNTDASLFKIATALPDLFHTTSPGVVVFFHGPHSAPDPQTDAKLELEATESGKEYRVGVQAVRTRRLNAPYGMRCKESYEDCDMRCVASRVETKRECSMYDLPVVSAAVDSICSEDSLPEYYSALVDAREECDCRPCSRTQYELADVRARAIPTTAGTTAADTTRLQYAAVVNTYLKGRTRLTRTQLAAQSFHQLFREVGLIFLLFLGISLVSILHALEYLLDLVFGCCNGDGGGGDVRPTVNGRTSVNDLDTV